MAGTPSRPVDSAVGHGESDVREWFAAQAFSAGAKLPSERELVTLLTQSRHQVKQAFSALERQGLIERRDGGWWMRGGEAADLTDALVVFAAQSPAPMPGTIPMPNQMSRIWKGMAIAAERHGVRLTTLLAPEVNPGVLKTLSEQRPLGVVCLGDSVISGQALLLARAAWSAEIPVVAMGDWVQPADLNQWPADLVFTSHAQGTRDVVHWLYAQGVRQPYLLGIRTLGGTAPSMWWNERQAGFAAACSELGLSVSPPCIALEDPEFDYGQHGLDEQARIFSGYLIAPLAAGADAFLCVNDLPAFSMAKALRLLGRKPNRDVLLAGFDNNQLVVSRDFWTMAGGGPLVTYDKKDVAMGEALIDLLMQRRRHTLPSIPQRVTLPGQLIELDPVAALSDSR